METQRTVRIWTGKNKQETKDLEKSWDEWEGSGEWEVIHEKMA